MTFRYQLEQLYQAATGRGAGDLHLFKPSRGNVFAPERRLNIYAEGYSERLRSAVRADYPALAAFMGAAAFETLVQAYVAATPSRHWDLNLYPINVPDMLEPGPARDLAQLEAAIAAVFWDADSLPMTGVDLAGIDEDRFAQMRFELRTASRLLRFYSAPDAYLTSYRAGNQPVTDSGPEYRLIIRHHNEVHRHTLDPLEYDVLAHLSQARTLTEVIEVSTSPHAAAERLPHWLGRWLAGGFFNQPALIDA